MAAFMRKAPSVFFFFIDFVFLFILFVFCKKRFILRNLNLLCYCNEDLLLYFFVLIVLMYHY